MHKLKLSLRQTVLFGMLGALTISAKVAMSGLYNIEPVSLLVMLYAAVFGWKAIFPISIYVAMEMLLYPVGYWNLNYLYVWGILAVAAYFMRKLRHPIWWALLSGLFGLSFGLLCTPVYAIFFGVPYAFLWWTKGIVLADPLHAAGNFVIALLLFVPMREVMQRLYKEILK